MEFAVAVADEGGFSAAARRLRVVQSAVSGTVKALETELGGKLFHRTTHRVSPTTLGEIFLPAARDALKAAQHVGEVVQRARGQLQGTLRIGVMQGVYAGLDRALARMRATHPAVTLELRQAAASELVQAVRAGRLDLAIVAVDPDQRTPVGLAIRTLRCEEMVLAQAKPEAGAGDAPGLTPVTLGEVAGMQLVEFSPGWAIRGAVDRAFAAAGIVRDAVFEVNDVLTATDLVRQRLGVCILPTSIASRFGDLTIRPFADPAPDWSIVVAYPDQDASPAVTALLAEIQ